MTTAPSGPTHSAAPSGLPLRTIRQAEGKARMRHLQLRVRGLVLWPANMSFHWTTVTPCRTQTAPRSGTPAGVPQQCLQHTAKSSHRPAPFLAVSRVGPPLPFTPLVPPPSASQAYTSTLCLWLCPCLPSFLPVPTPTMSYCLYTGQPAMAWTKHMFNEFIINESTVNQAPKTRNVRLSTERGAPRRLFRNPPLS